MKSQTLQKVLIQPNSDTQNMAVSPNVYAHLADFAKGVKSTHHTHFKVCVLSHEKNLREPQPSGISTKATNGQQPEGDKRMTIPRINPRDWMNSELAERIQAFNEQVDTIQANRTTARAIVDTTKGKAKDGQLSHSQLAKYRKAQDELLILDAQEAVLFPVRERIITDIEKAFNEEKDRVTAMAEKQKMEIRTKAEKAGHGESVIQALIDEDSQLDAIWATYPTWQDSTERRTLSERQEQLDSNLQKALMV